MKCLLLMLPLFMSCSMTQMKTAGEGIATVGVVTLLSSNPLTGALAGLLTFFGFEYVIADDEKNNVIDDLSAPDNPVTQAIDSALSLVYLIIAGLVLLYLAKQLLSRKKLRDKLTGLKKEVFEQLDIGK